MNKDVKSRGFTLVELLVVIAIIAVLAGILFPMFARAKESGMKTTALAQMKQIGTAFTLYVDGADGKILPSTNYGLPEGSPERMWPNNLLVFAKDKRIFVAPGSEGVFADTWDKRGAMTVGYNSSSAIDRQMGCSEDQAELSGCVSFKTSAAFEKNDPSYMALFACTPGGPVDQKYRGYEFSPYTGIPNPENPRLTPPLVSDRDLVKELADLPADQIKPIHARYLATGSDDGSTPVIFGDGHAKAYSAKEILANDAKIVWRLR
jgi:prepilin-type N-terminal cleavage/methylation domain-containing protein